MFLHPVVISCRCESEIERQKAYLDSRWEVLFQNSILFLEQWVVPSLAWVPFCVLLIHSAEQKEIMNDIKDKHIKQEFGDRFYNMGEKGREIMKNGKQREENCRK